MNKVLSESEIQCEWDELKPTNNNFSINYLLYKGKIKSI